MLCNSSMHIPDGYLSPSTCAAFYAASAPFWYVALTRVRNVFHRRALPLLGLFAAFCFVIMMFNLPVPGGTTAHAVGMGMASIVLGPWVSILAISMALLVQALFFGDGGITAFGANCFNMAIAGSLVAYVVYRLIARKAAIASPRRVIAAALAGYCAINVAAFCAAVEFGIQPLLFHNAAGVPLYAPYPLSISIPAMMIGHLTFAGMAELVISAGMVRYLQRADPEMLRFTAPDAPPAPGQARKVGKKRSLAALWAALGVVLVLTPLGILAVGSAWGEWNAGDFSNAAVRRQIAAASRNQAPPERVPAGLERLSSLWKAPVAGYELSFVRSRYAGYFASAGLGAGLILVLGFLIARPVPRGRRGFIERTAETLLSATQETLFAEQIGQSKGLLQSQDPRVKLAGIGALIVGAVAVRRIPALLALFAVAVLFALLSRVSLVLVAKRVWLAVLAFTGLIAVPAIFLVPGSVIYLTPLLRWPITGQGLTSACLLVLRAETAATFALLLVLSTPWNRLLRALRFFYVPASIVFLLETTYRYIFLLVKTSQEMIEARKARQVGDLEPRAQRQVASSMAGVLLDKTLQLSSEVSLAMEARGFRGVVFSIDDGRMRSADWLQLAALILFAAALVWIGR